jgi:hypothetical protein
MASSGSNCHVATLTELSMSAHHNMYSSERARLLQLLFNVKQQTYLGRKHDLQDERLTKKVGPVA